MMTERRKKKNIRKNYCSEIFSLLTGDDRKASKEALGLNPHKEMPL